MLHPAEAVSTTNVAVTAVAPDIGTEQVALEPLQEPDQAENFQPVDGVAVRVTGVLLATLLEQVPELQLMTPDDTTEPVPATVTLRVWLSVGRPPTV